MRAILAAAALALGPMLTSCAAVPQNVPEGSLPGPAALRIIEAALADSAAGWNEGDMDRFLAVYSDAPETSFVGFGELVRGRVATEERYRDGFDWTRPDPSVRGVLTFETVDFRPLGQEHALYIGRYILTYPDDREPASGLTSLVFARDGTNVDGWKIIADHSS